MVQDLESAPFPRVVSELLPILAHGMPEPIRVFEKRILLVEDDPTARESIKLLLMIDRHQVTEAEHSQQALLLFTPGRFDLVMIDYFMPNVQGNVLAAKIKQIDLGQPILLVTAFAEQLVDFGLPVDGILPKPFGIAELRHAVAQVLAKVAASAR